ncbi:hypothetical protein Trydic_g2778 [Trypoxylus dichotomus]
MLNRNHTAGTSYHAGGTADQPVDFVFLLAAGAGSVRLQALFRKHFARSKSRLSRVLRVPAITVRSKKNREFSNRIANGGCEELYEEAGIHWKKRDFSAVEFGQGVFFEKVTSPAFRNSLPKGPRKHVRLHHRK